MRGGSVASDAHMRAYVQVVSLFQYFNIESTDKSSHHEKKRGIYGVWATPTPHIYRLLYCIWAFFSTVNIDK